MGFLRDLLYSLLESLSGGNPLIVAIAAVVAVGAIATPFLRRYVSRRKRILYRVQSDSKIGLDVELDGDQQLYAAPDLGQVSKTLERLSFVVIRIRNTGRDISVGDLDEPVEFTFNGRVIWNARISDPSHPVDRTKLVDGLEFFSTDREVSAAAPPITLHKVRRTLAARVQELFLRTPTPAGPKQATESEPPPPVWHGIRLRRSLALKAKEKFKLIVVLREPATNRTGLVTKGVVGPSGRGRIKDERTVRQARWPLAVGAFGVLLSGLWIAALVVMPVNTTTTSPATEPMLFRWLVVALIAVAGAALVGGGVWLARRRATKLSGVAEVMVYTSNDNGEQLRDAVVELLEVAGFEVVSQDEPVQGSWFQRLFVRRRRADAARILGELAEEVARAAQIKFINSPRAEIDERETNAIAQLALAMSTMDEVVVSTSSILFIKTDGRVLARVLTEPEIRAIQKNPELMQAPRELLRALSMTAAVDAKAPTPNTAPHDVLSIEPSAPAKHLDVMNCPTCGHTPADEQDLWQQRRDLSVTWLSIDPDQPTRLVKARHCRQCRPRGPHSPVVCKLCGDGPVISVDLADQATNGTSPEAVLNWLHAQGWHDRPGVGLVCAAHD